MGAGFLLKVQNFNRVMLCDISVQSTSHFFEGLAIPRHEPAVMPFDMCERAEPVVLQLEHAIGMIEWRRYADERACGEGTSIKPICRLDALERVFNREHVPHASARG
jgi:hypothetical protein